MWARANWSSASHCSHWKNSIRSAFPRGRKRATASPSRNAEGLRPFLPHPLALTLEEMLVQGIESRLPDEGFIHLPLEQQEGVPALPWT